MGEVREIADQKIVNDLLKAGYIQAVVIDKSKIVDNELTAIIGEADGAKRGKKEEVKKTRKGGKKKSEN